MGSFQILDQNGQAMTIKRIDEEICNLLGRKIDNHNYCTTFTTLEKWLELNSEVLTEENSRKLKFQHLSREMSYNWFDTIGYCIANEIQIGYEVNWANVARQLIKKNTDISIFLEINEDKTEFLMNTDGSYLGNFIKYQFDIFLRNMIEIIEYFMKQGYSPKRID